MEGTTRTDAYLRNLRKDADGLKVQHFELTRYQERVRKLETSGLQAGRQ